MVSVRHRNVSKLHGCSRRKDSGENRRIKSGGGELFGHERLARGAERRARTMRSSSNGATRRGERKTTEKKVPEVPFLEKDIS